MYKLVFEDSFKKQYNKLDKSVAVIVKKWIDKHLVGTSNPKAYGEALSYDLNQYWRYRIGDYRLIVEIRDKELIIIAIDIVHRSEAYK